ncbi:MAG: DUF3662 and FHA domain-containing protein [Raoultibacter sp.]
MGFFSKFEGHVEDTFEGAADKMFDSPISPVQIAKKAEKQMRREKLVGAGKQYAPTLYTVLVNPEDDQRLFGYYPTLAGETETYLVGRAGEQGLVMDGQPLVRFIVDEGLKHGKFDIVAELVSGPIIAQLRAEEMQRYGLGGGRPAQPQSYAQPMPEKPVLPYVPEDELDYSIDYGEYTFDSQNFNEEQHGGGGAPVAQAPNTTVFAAGAAGVNAVPDQQAVRARLIDIGQNRAYGLAAARLILGRETSSDIIINDLNASRNHAELRFEPQGVWVITDLGSTNGTKVNGRIITSQPLYEGDQITIGVTNLIFTQE